MSGWWEHPYPGAPPVGPARLPRPLYAIGNPSGKPPSEDGPDVVAVKRAVSRLGRWPWQPFDDEFYPGFARGTGGNVGETGLAGFQRQMRLQATGNLGDNTYQALRYAIIPEGLTHAGEHAFDAVAVDLLERAAGAVPDLGPVWNGGASVLDQDLTHATSGIPLYPAFDDAFAEGRTVIAPEDIEVTHASSSNPGDACYCAGASRIDWWFGHLLEAPPVGARIERGAPLGVVGPNTIGGGPHVHVGVNVERLWGAFAELDHHTDYTHGAPTVGEQLAEGPPLV